MTCHQRAALLACSPAPLPSDCPPRSLFHPLRACPVPPPKPALPARRSSVRSLTRQLFQRELGRGPLTITRQHINAFRRSLTLEETASGEVVPRSLSEQQQDSLEFLRALFCCTHLSASFERLGSCQGDVLTQQVDTFLKMLKEPCPDDVTSSIGEGGHQLKTAVRRKAAFFEHLWRLGIHSFVVRLLTVDCARLPQKLFVRNKALCLRLIRRLGRRTLCQFGSRLLRALSEDARFVHYCFRLMAHHGLTEETVILLEDVFHHRRLELSLRCLSEVVSQTLAELRSPHLVAKVMRLLALMCSPTKVDDAEDRVWPSDRSKLVKPTAVSDANQLLLLTQVPNFLPQLLEVLDAGVMGSLPRARFNLSLDEEAHWFDWLDSQDTQMNRVKAQQGPFVRAAVSKVVGVVDLMESAMLLRILLLGPHSGILRNLLLTKFGIASRLCRYMDRLLWNDAELGLQNEDDGPVESLDLRPETPLKLQIVRCITALFESCSPAEKRLFHSKAELIRLRSLAEFLPQDERDPSLFSVDLKLCCQGGSGLLTRLAFALMQQPKLSSFRLWLSKCIETYLLDLQYPLADQQLLALMELPSAALDHSSVTLLEDQISQSFLHTKFTIGETITIQNTDVAGGLCQEMRVQACDTLATMIKFNVSTSCLFLTSVWDVVRKSSETTVNVSLSYSEQEKLASALMVNYFKFYKVISNVLLRAFAVTEAASLQKDEAALYSNLCFSECSDVYFQNAYDISRETTVEDEMLSATPNQFSNKSKGKLMKKPSIIDAGPSFAVVTTILAEMVYNLVMAINPSFINQSNVSCLNTSIVICVLQYRQHNLADFLVEVQACCKANKQDLTRFRLSLESLLSIWMDAYTTKTPKCLSYLACTWRMSVPEIRRIVSVILEDLRTNRFPFINHDALVDLLGRKQCQHDKMQI